VASVVFSDDAPCCIDDGAFTYEEAWQTLDSIRGPRSREFRGEFRQLMSSASADAGDRDFGIEQEMPAECWAKLLRWALYGDWWDAVSLIKVPSLMIGGKVSKNPWQNMVRYHERVPGSELVIFEEDEGGSHSMYWENPAKYNTTVLDFLRRH
jgi:non-heme chloroperoxidase